MRRIAPATLLVVALALLPVFAGSETVVIDPLPEKDMSYFKQEGAEGWKLDLVSDDVFNLLVCERQKDDSWIVWNRKPFKSTFEVRFEADGGSRSKGLEFYVIPPEGERIQVPFHRRELAKRGWHDLIFLMDEGKAHATVDGEKQEEVAIPKGAELRFGLKLEKRSEARLRKLMVRYLVVTEEQKAPEEGFVRIFDGKSMDGWKVEPAGSDFWKLADQRLEGNAPQNNQTQPVIQYADGRFQEFVLRFRVGTPCRGFHVLARYGIRDQYPAALPAIDGYVPGDREWSDIELTVKGKNIQLSVNGSRVWTDQAKNETPSPILFLLVPGGAAKLRDIRIQGRNMSPGPTWARYVKESGVDAAGATGFGGRAGPDAGSTAGGGGKRRDLFDGKSISEEWLAMPAGVWSVAQGRILGLTLDKANGAALRYKKYVFPEYRMKFSVEKGSKGATFVAKSDPHRKHPDVTVVLKPEWLGDRDWTTFEATVMDGRFKLACEGKVVAESKVFEEPGFVEWRIAPDSALGLKDIYLH